MARYRYLNCSELVAIRWLASEALRWRRPRRAARARMYVTHPGRDLAPLTLAVRQWLTQCAPDPEPGTVSAPVPATGTNPDPLRVPAPRTSPDLGSEPPTAGSPGSGFAAAVASRPRIQALRAGGRPRREPVPASGKAASRLRARTAAFRRTTHLTGDRDGLWHDSMAAARIRARGLGRAA